MIREFASLVGTTKPGSRTTSERMGSLTDEVIMYHLRIATLFLVAVVLGTAADVSDQLAHVKKIFVAPLEGSNNDYSQMVHEKLISGLMKVQGITVVDDEEDADAILTVSGSYESHPTEYGHTRSMMQGGVRLTSKEGGVVLWADNIMSSHFARSASSSFADNVAKRLGQAMNGGEKK